MVIELSATGIIISNDTSEVQVFENLQTNFNISIECLHSLRENMQFF